MLTNIPNYGALGNHQLMDKSYQLDEIVVDFCTKDERTTNMAISILKKTTTKLNDYQLNYYDGKSLSLSVAILTFLGSLVFLGSAVSETFERQSNPRHQDPIGRVEEILYALGVLSFLLSVASLTKNLTYVKPSFFQGSEIVGQFIYQFKQIEENPDEICIKQLFDSFKQLKPCFIQSNSLNEKKLISDEEMVYLDSLGFLLLKDSILKVFKEKNIKESSLLNCFTDDFFEKLGIEKPALQAYEHYERIKSEKIHIVYLVAVLYQKAIHQFMGIYQIPNSLEVKY